jgi:hypothetical protein
MADDDVRADFDDAVTMTAHQLEQWLETDESKAAGQHKGGGESTGHASGRRIVELLQKTRAISPTTTARTCAKSSATCTGTWPSARRATSSTPRGGTR